MVTGKIQLSSFGDILGGNTPPEEMEINRLEPFPEHPFQPYEETRLSRLSESIRESGVLQPVLVWETEGRFVILSGHNRVRAASMAGLERVPVRTMKGLTAEEARLVVTETNLHQRSLGDLPHTERARAIKAHYEAVKASGRRGELVKEVEAMFSAPGEKGDRGRSAGALIRRECSSACPGERFPGS